MNMPPEVPAMSAPPPPPPVRKSSALKWILIGCGGATFLGLLVCAGCFTLVYFAAKKMVNEAVAKVKPIIAENETVKAEIGEVTNVTPRFDFKSRTKNGRDTIECSLDVEGTKGKGVVLVKMYETGKGDDEFIVHLTFQNQDGSKKSDIGTWRLYDDGKGNSRFEPIKGEPPPEPDGDSGE